MYETIVTIDGMMCSMCTAHVNECIRNNFNVKKVKATLGSGGRTVIVSEAPLDKEKLEEKIESFGYKLTSFTTQEYKKKSLFDIFK